MCSKSYLKQTELSYANKFIMNPSNSFALCKTFPSLSSLKSFANIIAESRRYESQILQFELWCDSLVFQMQTTWVRRNQSATAMQQNFIKNELGELFIFHEFMTAWIVDASSICKGLITSFMTPFVHWDCRRRRHLNCESSFYRNLSTCYLIVCEVGGINARIKIFIYIKQFSFLHANKQFKSHGVLAGDYNATASEEEDTKLVKNLFN